MITKEEALAQIEQLKDYINSFDNNLNKIAMMLFDECEKPFYMAKHQVTQELWETVTGNNPSHFKGNPQFPVESVSYNDIVNIFLPKLNKLTGKQYRLPTEYEWMLCAQVDNTIYSGSDNIDEVAVYGETSPLNVGSKKPNSLGIYDMSGNVWEWCDSIFEFSDRVIRGGSWSHIAEGCRVASRSYGSPGHSYNYNYIGFRLALSSLEHNK